MALGAAHMLVADAVRVLVVVRHTGLSGSKN